MGHCKVWVAFGTAVGIIMLTRGVSAFGLSPPKKPVKPSNALKFFKVVGDLKTLKRTGWVEHNVAVPESVADHMVCDTATLYCPTPVPSSPNTSSTHVPFYTSSTACRC